MQILSTVVVPSGVFVDVITARFCPAASESYAAVQIGYYSVPVTVDASIRESQVQCQAGR
jgi:hypothetical protein